MLRIFAGDFKPGEVGDVRAARAMWLATVAIMVVPIVMVVVSVTFDGQVARWAHIVAAAGLFLFNIVGLPTYPGLYDKALIVVGLLINALTIWTAWGWDGS